MISGIRGAYKIAIPRCFLEGILQRVEAYTLQGFCDASNKAYGAVVYLQIMTSTGNLTRFIASKTRVAPLRKQTIPRLELLSALLLSRLMVSITRSLESILTLSEPTCYTDSKVALYWILGTSKEWKQFVQNRVTEIRKCISPSHWKHCAGKDNPADLPSRGLSLPDLSLSQLWSEGPEWLNDDISEIHLDDITIPEECVTELRGTESYNLLVTEERKGLSEIIDCQRYSNINRLLGVTAYVLRIMNNIRQTTDKNGKVHTSITLSANEISSAKTLWIKEVQKKLTASKNFETWKRQFGLFTDAEGLWRCGGRLSNAEIPYSTKHPILLLKDHHFTTLVILRAHKRVSHNGVRETLTELRSIYWIIRGRSAVKSIIRQCTVCLRYEGKPYTATHPPPLPEFRVRERPPFSYTGVDFAGPLHVKERGNNGTSKVWICLYTCCVVRAVHLDIIPNLTTSAFLRSFKRFTARRGLPQRLISDNAKTFTAAAELIKATTVDEEVQGYLAGVGVEWQFNLEKAPWWGGIFERMVQSTKRCLRKIVGRSRLNYDELLTVVIEVEAIINSRPLSYVSSDDLEEPLTPSHFLTGRRLLSFPDRLCHGHDNDEDYVTTHEGLTRRLKHLNTVLNQFRKKWHQEYLLELREGHRYGKRSTDKSPISVGTIVLVHDDKPRGFWRTARVNQLITGKDGLVRGAVVRITSGKDRVTELQRPIQLLFPLKVDCCESQLKETDQDGEEENSEDVTTNHSETSSSKDVGNLTVGRPLRAAAEQAREKILNWSRDDQV